MNTEQKMEVGATYAKKQKKTCCTGACNIVGQVVLALVCVVAVGVLLYQVYTMVQHYMTYPKETTLQYHSKERIEFPHVTVCSTKPLDLVVTDTIYKAAIKQGSMADSLDLTKPGGDETLLGFFDSYQEFYNRAYRFNKAYISTYGSKGKTDMMDVYSSIGLVANTPPELAMTAGIKLEELVISCKVLNKDCGKSEAFVRIFDTGYYNCYTLKPEEVLPESGPVHVTRPEVSLLLFTSGAGPVDGGQSVGSMPGMGESDSDPDSGGGALVVIHAPDTEPSPAADGTVLAPGVSTTLDVATKHFLRLSAPYGNCKSGSPDSPTEAAHQYTARSCYNQCRQEQSKTTCGCRDSRISPAALSDQTPLCLEVPEISDKCLQEAVTTSGVAGECLEALERWQKTMNCTRDNGVMSTDQCSCQPPCSEIQFSQSQSTVPLAGNAFNGEINAFLDELESGKKDVLQQVLHPPGRNESDWLPLANHVAHVRIRFDGANMVTVIERVAYPISKLMSEIGSSCAFWMLVFVASLFGNCALRRVRRRHNRA